MKYIQYLILWLIIGSLMLIPQMTDGFARRGGQGEGLSTYIVVGYIEDNGIAVVLTSEVANESSASRWEVNIAIIVTNQTQSYRVEILDSHQAQHPDYDTGSILSSAEKDITGNVVYDPWSVWAFEDSEQYGPLIWEIFIQSLDGKETYIYFTMVWSFANRPPPKIDDGEGVSTATNQSEILNGTKEYTAIELFFIVAGTVISGMLGMFIAWNNTKPKPHRGGDKKIESDSEVIEYE